MKNALRSLSLFVFFVLLSPLANADDYCIIWEPIVKEVFTIRKDIRIIEITFDWYGCTGRVLVHYLPLNYDSQPEPKLLSNKNSSPTEKDMIGLGIKIAMKKAKTEDLPRKITLQLFQKNHHKLEKMIFEFESKTTE